MKRSHKNLMMGALVLMMSSPVMAGYHDRSEHQELSREARIENRIDHQYERIERGSERHRLSPGERNRVLTQLRKIHRLSQRYERDGRISGHEYKRLDHKLDKNSELIRELSENDINRYVIYHEKYAKRGNIKHFER
ncbi:MAG: hypothetical protein P8101_19360 [Candidatus Thiodiazotropha sp.]|jgi:hypothetical protein